MDNLCGVLPVLLSLNNFTDILFDFVSLSLSLFFSPLFAFSLFLFFRDLMSPRSKYGVRIDERDVAVQKTPVFSLLYLP